MTHVIRPGAIAIDYGMNPLVLDLGRPRIREGFTVPPKYSVNTNSSGYMATMILHVPSLLCEYL
jgi:hypothetical protein